MSERYFVVGGPVQATAGMYVTRPADDELFKYCQTGNFCYVLAPRQVGKSSLMIHTAKRLSQLNITFVIIDLSILGTSTQADEWFFSFVFQIAHRLSLSIDYESWWEDNTHLSNSQRLNKFFRQIVLEQITSPIVVFVDEIDMTLALPFSDDFFSAISTMTTDPVYQRLSFVLIGVAMPAELISNRKISLFPSGYSVRMTYFTFDDISNMVQLLDIPDEMRNDVAKWVFEWTNGHPFLTQKLCSELSEMGENPATIDEIRIANIVTNTFMPDRKRLDPNLSNVERRLLFHNDRYAILNTYKHIAFHEKEKPIYDGDEDIIKYLELTGIIQRNEDGETFVSNKIYAKAFDLDWIKENASSGRSGHFLKSLIKPFTRTGIAKMR